MEKCPKCGTWSADRNTHTGRLLCFKSGCGYEERSPRMTSGEKAIWASVYAQWIKRIEDTPKEFCVPKPDREKYMAWRAAIICEAVENACYAVEYVREAKEAVEGEYGNGEVFKMLCEMVGD